MKSADLFALVAGGIGFVVNVVTLLALLSGWVSIPDGSFFKSPFAFGVITYFIALYSTLLILYFWSSAAAEKFYSPMGIGALQLRNKAVSQLAFLLWVPVFLLWSIVVFDAGQKAGYVPIVLLPFGLFWFFNVVGCGGVAAEIVELFHKFLHPDSSIYRIR